MLNYIYFLYHPVFSLSFFESVKLIYIYKIDILSYTLYFIVFC